MKKFGGSLWDGDHIIPVKDGGGCSSLENMRTLCIACHKIETAQTGTRGKKKDKC